MFDLFCNRNPKKITLLTGLVLAVALVGCGGEVTPQDLYPQGEIPVEDPLDVGDASLYPYGSTWDDTRYSNDLEGGYYNAWETGGWESAVPGAAEEAVDAYSFEEMVAHSRYRADDHGQVHSRGEVGEISQDFWQEARESVEQMGRD